MNGPVLVATDFQATSHGAFEAAVRWAERAKEELLVCHIMPGRFMAPGDERATTGQILDVETIAEEENARLLTTWAEKARAVGIVTTTVHRVADPPAKAIVAIAQENGCSAIVVGTHGRTGLKRAVLGSVAEGVVRHSSVPVLVVPPPTPGP